MHANSGASGSPRPAFWVALFLVLLCLGAFWPVFRYGFIAIYDDDLYVTERPEVQAGLSPSGVVWAFTTTAAYNWHPLTWLSHMLDCELYGLNAAGHHTSSILIHAANAVLLFLVLARMTKAVWPSAWVAALFAVHPLHVESVAWIAERKDVLSTLFALLAMAAYARYAARPSIRWYMVVVAGLALSLMAKAMFVTLPLLLLLLDLWPLRRFTSDGVSEGSALRRAGRLVLEKAPLLALSALSSLVAVLTQRHGGAMQTLERFPLGVRLSNAAVAYVAYIAKTIWPAGLAVYYPHPQNALPIWQVAGSAGLLALVTIAALTCIRTRPYLLTGWLWYLLTLAPVIGIIQVGQQAMADRYTYFPIVGLFIGVAWGLAESVGRRSVGRQALACCGVALIGVLSLATVFQVRHWQNGRTLFEQAIRVNTDNSLAHRNLAMWFARRGLYDAAEGHLEQALDIDPAYVDAHNALGMVFLTQDKLEPAAEHFERAITLDPHYAAAHNNLGVSLVRLGRNEQAEEQFAVALALDPDNAEMHANFAEALQREGRWDEAAAHFGRALQLRPGLAAAQAGLERCRAEGSQSQ